MTDLPDWAKDKAREWLDGEAWKDLGRDEHGYWGVEGLAALLVEVAAVGEMVRAEDAEYLSTLRSDVLAEVRRVVEGFLPPDADDHRKAEGDNVALDRYWTGWTDALDSTLDALDPLRAEDLLDGLPRFRAEVWCCEGCGEMFDEPRTSHGRAAHAPGCDGSCRSCPVEVECGPITAQREEGK